jgi:predicted nucleic acid-binding protein
LILADTSGLLALLDAGEPSHARVREVVARERGPLVTTDLVLAELDFLVLRRLGGKAERAFLGQVLDGRLLREPVDRKDLVRASRILESYPDPSFGLTDASLMVIAERLAVPVLTLDRRHFTTFRDQRGKALTLLP